VPGGDGAIPGQAGVWKELKSGDTMDAPRTIKQKASASSPRTLESISAWVVWSISAGVVESWLPWVR
jgi:hypothetical protein